MLIDPAFADPGNSAKYGSLAETVEYSGFLLAATLTLSLGWMRRSGSSWVPPEEAVPMATTRFASLITAVCLALIYVFLHKPERMVVLAPLTFLSLLFAVTGLFCTIYLMKTYGFETTRKNWRGKEVKVIKLGGSEFTHDAQEATRIRNVEPGRLFKEADGDLELIYTRQSLAKIHTIVTATFLALQSFGSIALGGAGLLLSLASPG